MNSERLTRTWLFLPALMLVIAVVACGSSTSDQPADQPGAGTGAAAATEIPKTERLKTTSQEEFNGWLIQAAADRDFETMAGLMRDPFEIRVFAAGGSLRAPSIAIEQINSLFYPPEDFVIDCKGSQPLEDLEEILGMDPRDFYEGSLSFLFCTGWGPEGAGEALLALDLDDEGFLYWTSITVALNGFAKSSR